MRKTSSYVGIGVLFLVVLLSGFLILRQNYFVDQAGKNNTTVVVEKKSEPAKDQVAPVKISIIIDKLVLNPTVSSGTSLYDILINEKNNSNLNLVGKTSPGLGFFVTEIGSLKSTDTKYIVYYINGESAMVGISSYFPKDGDVIEWKYTD